MPFGNKPIHFGLVFFIGIILAFIKIGINTNYIFCFPVAIRDYWFGGCFFNSGHMCYRSRGKNPCLFTNYDLSLFMFYQCRPVSVIIINYVSGKPWVFGLLVSVFVLLSHMTFLSIGWEDKYMGKTKIYCRRKDIYSWNCTSNL